MKWMQEQRKHENLTYLVLWGMLFIAPVLSLYLRSVDNPAIDFEWKEVFMIWRQFVIFLLIFLIHNFFLAPVLVGGPVSAVGDALWPLAEAPRFALLESRQIGPDMFLRYRPLRP